MTAGTRSKDPDRARLLQALPVAPHVMDVAGIPTEVLVGGDGPPMILLHGPGEPAVWWMRVIPQLVRTHRVIAPDMPGHGATGRPRGPMDADAVLAWLDALITRTCPEPPVLVGHVLGGAVAARYAVDHSDRIAHLVLVDSLGLGRFFPSARFAVRLMRFLAKPTEERFDRFLGECMYDSAGLQAGMGELWEPFMAYHLRNMQTKETKEGMQILLKHVGMPRIPDKDLARIRSSTSLIWGRHDQANKIGVATAASERFGWPLHIIEDARDDPKLERPEAFLQALYKALAVSTEETPHVPVAG